MSELFLETEPLVRLFNNYDRWRKFNWCRFRVCMFPSRPFIVTHGVTDF